jgi:hypothetical protein
MIDKGKAIERWRRKTKGTKVVKHYVSQLPKHTPLIGAISFS